MVALHRVAFVTMIGSILLMNTAPPKCFAQIAPPEQVLGKKVGSDFYLATYEEAMTYFDRLASQTERMQMFDMGPTSFGRRMRYAVISSEENMANLDRYKEISQKLSLARGVSEEEAESLAEEGRVVVWIDGGLHGTEVVGAQQNIQLAYDIVTGNDRITRSIRDNVILLVVFANPDGMTIVSDWYMEHVGTRFETSRLPWLYGKVGHDNNRDSTLGNIVETRNINRVTSSEWCPQILFNQHQRGPFPCRIFIPPNAEPTNPNQHPILIRSKNFVGTAMGKAFAEADQPGVVSRISYDSWFPGYVEQAAEGHNIVAILTETQSFHLATPHFYTVNDFPETFQDLVVGTFYPEPWLGGWWRFSDQVAYNLTASKSILDIAAKHRHEFLFNKWKMAIDIIERFENEPPYGWVISAEQRSPNTTAYLLDALIVHGIEVHTADEAFVHEGISYPKGSYIVPTSQPYGLYAKNLLEIQDSPDLREQPHIWQGLVGRFPYEGPPFREYDNVGWTLPVQMGIESRVMSSPLDTAVSKSSIAEAPSPAGTLTGTGAQYVFSHADSYSFRAVNRILEKGGKVSWALDDFTLGQATYPKGTFIVDGRSIGSNILESIADETRIPMRGGAVRVESTALSKPRIAIYKSWVANMDAAWIIWLFEEYQFPFYELEDAEVKAGALRNRYDVIILPDQSAESIIDGHREGTMPSDYVGGITRRGLENLKEFVEAGGTLICNGDSSLLAIDNFKLPVKNVLHDVPAEDFNCPGSILRLDYDTDHPLTFGMEENGIAYFSRRALAFLPYAPFAEGENEERTIGIVGRFPDEPLLISGKLEGGEKIRGKAAILDVPIGEGRAVLFGFNVHSRAQAHATFKLLFNAIYYR